MKDPNEREWDAKTRKLAACLEALLELDRAQGRSGEAPEPPESGFHAPKSVPIAGTLRRE